MKISELFDSVLLWLREHSPRVYSFSVELLDWVWPIQEPLTKEQIERREERRDRQSQLSNTIDIQTLDSLLEQCVLLIEGEEKRHESVETRLVAVLTLAPIAQALVLAVVAFAADSKNRLTGYWSITALALIVYVTLNLLAALLASVSGLSRRAYPKENLEGRYRLTNEGEFHYKQRRYQQVIEVLDGMDANANWRITKMAIGHHALRNSMVGMLVLTIVVSAYLVVIEPADHTRSSVASTEQRFQQSLGDPPQRVVLPPTARAALPPTAPARATDAVSAVTAQTTKGKGDLLVKPTPKTGAVKKRPGRK